MIDMVYVSFDIEASGKTPGKYSLLSLWACSVQNLDEQFYSELKPISPHYIPEAVRIGALWLKCIQPHMNDSTCNPLHVDFIPERVLAILSQDWETPKDSMERYVEWLENIRDGKKLVEVAAPIRFDSMWTTWYLDNFFEGDNPFGATGGEDMNSLYRGVMRNTRAHIKDLQLRSGELTHNALDDALQQAKEFQSILSLFQNE